MSCKDISDKQVVEAVQAYQKDHSKFPYEILAQQTGQCEKVCYRALERASKRGLIDYGVSLRTGWLTKKGLELLDVECTE